MGVKVSANARSRSGAGDRARVRRAARQLVIRRLRARREEIEEAIWVRVRGSQFDRTGSEDPHYVAGLRAAAAAALEHMLSGIEGAGRHDAEPAPAAAIAQARRAARTGVELGTVLRRYVAGYTLLERFITEEIERDERLAHGPVPGDVQEVAAELVERMITAVSDAYRAEIKRVAPSSAPAPASSSSAPASSSSSSSSHGPVFQPEQRALRQAGAPVGTQRARIMGAIVEVVAERGYAGASVGAVIERARVARRTFYEQFPGGLDEGLNAVLDDVLAQTGALAAAQLERHETWQEGVCAAMASLLMFLDSEPELARVCFIHTSGAGPTVVEHRERVMRAFRARIAARIESEGVRVSPLTAESVLASIFGVIRARLVSPEQNQMIELLGPLMEILAIPLAASEQLVREERRRGDELARAIQAGEVDWARPSSARGGAGTGAAEAGGESDEDALPALLINPSARRLRECLRHVAEHPGSSNREVAAGIGVTHSSQISKLLSELADAGLASRLSEGAGKRNAWWLTERGMRAARILSGNDVPPFDLTESQFPPNRISTD